jgi:hypothetical protein
LLIFLRFRPISIAFVSYRFVHVLSGAKLVQLSKPILQEEYRQLSCSCEIERQAHNLVKA